MRRFLNYISSRRFAVTILVVTTAVILAASLLPNISVMEADKVEKLREENPFLYGLSVKFGVKEVTRSPYFQVIPVFLFLSVAVCTLRRFKAELERREKGRLIPQELPVTHSFSLPPGGPGKDDIASILRKKRWKILLSDAERAVIYARKGEDGVWGSFAFHAGMEIALIGILISVMMGVEGRLMLTEGFPITTPDELQGLKRSEVPDFPFDEVMLKSFTPVFEGRFPVEYNTKLVGVERGGGVREYEVGVNRPLVIGGYKFIYNRANYAPRFLLKRDNGEVVVDAITNLMISMPGKVDSFEIPEEGMKIKVEMFPDYYKENGEHKTRGKYPFNPVLFVDIEKEGKMIGRGFLPKEKRVDFDKYSLEFTELRHQVDLIVSRDAGVFVITASFIIIAFGLLIRFILNDKQLWIIINKDRTMGVGGRARFFPALFEEELKRLTEDLKLKTEEEGSKTRGEA